LLQLVQWRNGVPELSSEFIVAIGFAVLVPVLIVVIYVIHLIISSNQLQKKNMELNATQEQLLTYYKKLQALAEHAALAEEEQRRKIAEELHDRIGQTLALSRIKLTNLQNQDLSQQTHQSLEELENLIQDILKDIRSLTIELSPPALYDLGPEAAIETLAKHYEKQHKIRIEFNDDGAAKPLEDKIALFIYKAARELLVNALKHARASRIWIYLRQVEDKFRVEIKDDGIGFNPENLHPERGNSGFGLFNIKDRLNFYNGKMLIDSQPGNGSRFVIEVPLKNVRPWENGYD